MQNKTTFEKVLGEDVPEIIRSYKQKVPEKALDVTGYPFSDKWKEQGKGQAVALVSRAWTPSLYSDIADGQNVGATKPALVVFMFEAAIEDDKSVDESVAAESEEVAPPPDSPAAGSEDNPKQA